MPDFLANVLTEPRNSHYMLLVQSAMDLHLPPTFFMYDEEQPKWGKADKKLAVAWTILERERCQYCGQPLWICRSSERNLLFKVNTDTCMADAELNRKENVKKAENLKPGEHQYVIPYRRDGKPMPSRAEYLQQLQDDED